ncbi:hypothetical protein [Burkholderia pseudomallei]|uniref:hypothetical protein n=1 Tax=Burkholderia pseudomallei TaxID=28450 RepID=UPI0012F50B6A|nr:hypothetical protein [Burkholderia pseudomallei]
MDIEQLESSDPRVEVLAWPFAKGASFMLVYPATNSLALVAAPSCTAGWLSVKTDRHGTGEFRWKTIRPRLQRTAQLATAV